MTQIPVKDIKNGISDLNINDPGYGLDNQNCLAPPWKDITKFLDEATNEMEEGQLLHLQSFTLFDAMCAIEIMDPRMDTGMVIDEGKRKKYDIEQVLNPLQVLWIMDKLLSCEMAWISGHSLAQTVYTCIYFHHVPTLMDLPPPPLNTADIDSVIQCVLKAFILASVKCCQHVWKEMISGNIFEEEDFTTNLFGLSLYDQLSDMDAFNDLSLALRILKTYIEGNEVSDELKNNLLAIYERLSLRKSFLQALIYFEQPRCSHIHQVKKSLNEIMALLDNNSNKTKDPAITILGSLDSGVEIEGAFDPNINRKLTTQSPPRSVSLPSSQKTYDDFLKLIQRLESICNIIKFPSVTSLMNYFACFAGSKPYPDALSRSKLNSLFYSDGYILGSFPVGTLITGSIFDFVKPPSYWFQFEQQQDDSPLLVRAKQSLCRFLEQNVSLPFIDFFKIQCHNRARQRRILCKVLGEWEVLQDEAFRVDTQFQEAEDLPNTFYFSVWAYNIKLKLMEQILLLGFELELYGEHEYTTIYWYHWYIQSILASHLQNNDNNTNKEVNDDEGKKNNDRIQQQQQNKEDITLMDHIEYIQLLNGVKKDLSIGVFKLLLAVEKSGQWKKRPLKFDDPLTRFNHRLKPFIPLSSPPFQDYNRFLSDSATDHLTVETLLQAASTDFFSCKRTLDMLMKQPESVSKSELCHDEYQKNILSMIKTCVGNNITILKLLKQDDSKDTTVMIEFKYHAWWPVVQLV